MHIFYSQQVNEGVFVLNEDESKHAVKVLRLQEKDPVIVVDGKGAMAEGEIAKANSRECEIRTKRLYLEYGKRPFSIHIAIAPTKNIDRIEWFVEKAIEIGIDEISFIQCQRSERKHINPERITKIAISAMKQSIKAYLPIINEMVPFSKFMNQVKAEECFIAHLEEGNKKELKTSFKENKRYCILIGPEGDFSPEEIELSKSKGFIPVSLGQSRLRTETAGIIACHTFHLMNNHE